MYIFERIVKKAVRHIALVMLIGIIGFASLGTSVNLHFCNGKLQLVNVFGIEEDCAMTGLSCPNETSGSCCENHKSSNRESVSDLGCCVNLALITKTNLDNGPDPINCDLNGYDYVPIIRPAINLNGTNFKPFKQKFHNYKPPLIQEDISVLYETFLI